MALKLDPVRLLIADDVGVGKTIEALLIARELLDRGDIDRTVVLCPPHLVDQWVTELEVRFHIHAVAVTAQSTRRLERGIPPGASIFSQFPHTVVSLDYVKTSERRDHFLQACPDFVIVDEAHTCAAAGQRRHQRRELLQGLAASPRATSFCSRRLRTAAMTPPSTGCSACSRRTSSAWPRLRMPSASVCAGVWRVISCRDGAPTSPSGATATSSAPRNAGTHLQPHGRWEAFFNDVLDYCAEVVETDAGNEQRQRLNFWGTLALLRCTGSSPVAAVLALRTRAGEDLGDEAREDLLDRIFDGDSDALVADDVEPPAGGDSPPLARLIGQAENLAGQSGDPKLRTASLHVAELVKEGFNVVVFCRFIATAHYVARHLRDRLKGVAVGVVTGELPPDERAARVAEIGATEGSRVLVTTDCLSEGVNLQDYFDAVVHYDLSWNPTRHEQREGRVDRFGQPSKTVRATLLYGNNPIDGAVLQVILRKAARIREELGVPVPVPDEGHSLTQALLKAVLLRRRGRSAEAEGQQLELFEDQWRDTRRKAIRNRTVFAQRRIRPDEVLPEWHKSRAAVGSREDVERFAGRALARLGSGLEPTGRGFKVPTAPLPAEVRERLETEDIAGTVAIDFAYPSAPGCRPVQRSHPLIAVLAETLLARTLSVAGNGSIARDPSVLGRVGCWISEGVRARSTVVLLRLRHQLVTRTRHAETTLMVEEAAALAWIGAATADPVAESEAIGLLAHAPAGDPPRHVREREVARALALLRKRAALFEACATARANALLEDHLCVREAGRATGRTTVQALPRPDVIGVYVLLPRLD